MNTYEVIKALCDKRNLAVTALEKELGFGRGSLGKLKDGKSISSDRLKEIADYFEVSMDYLMTGEDHSADEPYYLNDDARDLAEFLFHNPDYKVLFDASRKVKKEDIEFVKNLIDRMQ